MSDQIWDVRSGAWRARRQGDPTSASGLPERLPFLHKQYLREDVPERRIDVYESYTHEKQAAQRSLSELESALVWAGHATRDRGKLECAYLEAMCASSEDIRAIVAEPWIEKFRHVADSVEHSRVRVAELEARYEASIDKMRDAKASLDMIMSKNGR